MAKQSKRLNLFLVTRTDKWDWDEYSEFIVCCKTEQEARETYPEAGYVYDKNLQAWKRDNGTYYGKYPGDCLYKGSWIYGEDIESLDVETIGVASSKFIKKDILLASFHSG